MESIQNAGRRTFLSRLPFVGAFFAGTAATTSTSDAFEQSDVPLVKRVALLEKAVTELRLPIGTVIPFGGDATTIPSGLWLLCDGKTEYKADDYPELARLVGGIDTQGNFVLPDWSGRVIRGAKQHEPAFGVGGSDHSAVSATSASGNHEHQLPDETGLISLVGGVPNPENAYSVQKDGKWHHDFSERNPQAYISVSKGRGREGHHRHILGGVTRLAGEHTHPIPPLEVVPRYVALRFLIKARHVTKIGPG